MNEYNRFDYLNLEMKLLILFLLTFIKLGLGEYFFNNDFRLKNRNEFLGPKVIKNLNSNKNPEGIFIILLHLLLLLFNFFLLFSFI